MNQPVRDLMTERADRLDAPDLDVAAILRDGSTRLRRRRARLAGAAGVVAACGVVAATAGPGMLSTPSRPAATDVSFASAFAERDPAYAVGSTVHLDRREFTVPTPVLAMVQTTAGIVYSDRDGDVWSASGDAEAVRVGTTDEREPHLAADGSSAVWTERTGMGTWPGREFVVLDQDSDETVRVPAEVPVGSKAVPGAPDPQAVALDDGDLYLRDGRGLVRVDLATGIGEVVPEARDDVEVVDVERGLIAHVARQEVEDDELVRPERGFVSPTVGSGTRVDAWTMLDLSDDGTRLLGETEPDTFAVFVVEAGTHELISSPDHDFLVGYRWLDSDTYLALGMNPPYDSTPVDLLRCDLGASCTVAAPAIGTVDDGMVLPVGEPMDG